MNYKMDKDSYGMSRRHDIKAKDVAYTFSNNRKCPCCKLSKSRLGSKVIQRHWYCKECAIATLAQV